MNVILLTAMIFTVALFHEGQGVFSNCKRRTYPRAPPSQPCQKKADIKKYNTFVKRHIVAKGFPRDWGKWERYLKNKGLCGRPNAPVQSFIDAPVRKVKQICRGGGRRVQDAEGRNGNLCISKEELRVCDVRSNKNCKVSHVQCTDHKVVVACDNVNNSCLPVHYEKYTDQQPDNIDCA